MVQLEIDGIRCEVSENCNVIEAARLHNVIIPRFCFHKRLSVAANCRMCLVEIEKSPKLVPACTVRVTEGMKVFTTTSAVLKAQKDVMEFLLINHPLDCPICDQGGECELQDISIKHGYSKSFFKEDKRITKNEDFGPLIDTVFSRCILCTRCVRFGAELGGVIEIGVIGRGVHSRVSTFVKKIVESVISGNIIDLCPVGALTSKVFKFKARSWELSQHSSVSLHDCVGSNLYVHTSNNIVLRVVAKENEFVNDVWISDRDRFSYEGLYSTERLVQPSIKENNMWKTVSWEELFSVLVSLFNNFKKTGKSNDVGVFLSPNCTNEEFFLCQKLFRSLNINNIDCYNKHYNSGSSKLYEICPKIDVSLDFFERKNSGVFLVGASIYLEQPVLISRFNKLRQLGGKICSINVKNFNFQFTLNANIVIQQGSYFERLVKIAKAIAYLKKVSLPNLNLDSIVVDVTDTVLAENLLSIDKKIVLIGESVIADSNFSNIYSICTLIATLLDAKVGMLTAGANSAGGWFFGCVPNKFPGNSVIQKKSDLSSFEMFNKNLNNYIFVNVEPNIDFLYKNLVNSVLYSKKDNIICFTPFISSELRDVATILIPIALHYESDGSFINFLGMFQSFKKVVSANSNVKQLWKIFSTLGNLLKISGFTYTSASTITKECKDIFSTKDFTNEFSENNVELQFLLSSTNTAQRIKEEDYASLYQTSLYQSDSLVRRAVSLQKVKLIY